MNEKHQKAREMYMHAAAEFLEVESNRMSLITVTNATLAPSRTAGTIFITVFPDSDEAHVLEFLKRKRDDFREYLKKKIDARTLPRFEFAIDQAEKERVRIDEALRNNE